MQPHEVELHVLPRGQVRKPSRILVGDIGQHSERAARQHALRDLHAHHLRVVRLPLSVRAAHQPECAPLLCGDLAALESAEHVDEFVYLGLLRKGRARAGLGRCGHLPLPVSASGASESASGRRVEFV